MSATVEQFEKDGKTYPTLRLRRNDEDKIFFSFGVSKARLIINHIEEIKKFIAEYGKASQ